MKANDFMKRMEKIERALALAHIEDLEVSGLTVNWRGTCYTLRATPEGFYAWGEMLGSCRQGYGRTVAAAIRALIAQQQGVPISLVDEPEG